jgi:hypothetical protein
VTLGRISLIKWQCGDVQSAVECAEQLTVIQRKILGEQIVNY